MELKYKVADVQELIDVFCSICSYKSPSEIAPEDIIRLTKYPEDRVIVFLNAIEDLCKTDKTITKENYLPLLGYICIRMNICEPRVREDF